MEVPFVGAETIDIAGTELGEQVPSMIVKLQLIQ